MKSFNLAKPKKRVTTTKTKKRKYNRDYSEFVSVKNYKTVVNNMKLVAKMCDLSFTIFCAQKLGIPNTFTARRPKMSQVIACSKIAGVRKDTFLNKQLKIKLIPA